MSEVPLINWLNTDVKLSKQITSIPEDFQNGYYFAEILHIFGAVDLYYSSKYVPEDYVNYCNLTKCDDIMYSVYTGDDIQHGFSDIDAYYVGLIDKPSIIDEYNFRER